jgi:hypothetical protein
MVLIVQPPWPDPPPNPIQIRLFLTLLTSALKMKAVWSSETLVLDYKTTRHNNSKYHHLYHLDNLKGLLNANFRVFFYNLSELPRNLRI